MSATCCICSTNITKERFPGIKCSGVCEKLFHVRCANISEDLLKGIKDRSANWLCEKCRATSSQSIIESDISESECNVSLADIMQQLKKMECKLSAFDELKLHITNLEKDNNLLTSKIHELEEQLDKFNSKLHFMEAEHDKPNQLNIANCIAISGLPMKHGDIRGVIINTFNKIGQQVELDDIHSIEQVHRSTKTAKTNTTKTNKIFHDFFIVKLKSLELKHSILAQMRKKKIITTKDLDVILPQNHPEQRIFIMHHFTKFQSQLYSEAKNIKAKFNYKYLWVKAGQIYLRKTAESDVHRIHSWNDILLLRNNFRPAQGNTEV